MDFVVLISNNDGGYPATIHASLEHARAYIQDYLTDAENNPPLTADERQRMERDLAELCGEYVEMVRGSAAWKEVIYVSPVEDHPRTP